MLQLVTYDEEEWSSDNIQVRHRHRHPRHDRQRHHHRNRHDQVMRKTLGSIDGKMQGALDWLRDPTAMQVKQPHNSLFHLADCPAMSFVFVC